MRLLIMTGPLIPRPGNNANLIGKLIPHFRTSGHEVHLFSATPAENEKDLPDKCFDAPVHWVVDHRSGWRRKLLYPAVAKVTDRNGYSDALQVQILKDALRLVHKDYPFDAVIATSEPYSMAVAALNLKGVKKVLYIMDPPACVSNGVETAYRNRVLPSLLKKNDAILTTPFIKEALLSHGFQIAARMETVGFPMIGQALPEKKVPDDGRIRLLFCGWLYSGIRSPEYFLNIVSRLDHRFEVTFMGKECETLPERFPVETKATIICRAIQPYETALQAMADADVLINIGNSVPVHMPSKTLEYINTGKPIVNFYKFADCPTLYYTEKYPLALNLFEGDKDADAAAERFIRFCESHKGQKTDQVVLQRVYEDCTPQYIADLICDIINH